PSLPAARRQDHARLRLQHVPPRRGQGAGDGDAELGSEAVRARPAAGRRLMGLLDGRVALVTGGSRGLGRSLCATLAREGARVAFNYTRREEDAAATREACGARGYKVSVLDRAGLATMVKSIEADLGPIDVLVNNAGIGQVVPLALMEEEDWDRMLSTNVKG